MEYIELNEFQTPLSDLELEKQPLEIQEQFWDFFYSVPFIQSLVSKDRPRAKDLPRDNEGKIIVDITHPHILEDMDYFRPSALYFQQNGCYTKLRPNGNPNSQFGRWCKEEARRCRYGYVRELDGEWITGDYYYFLNYAPMSLLKRDDKNSKKGKRVIDFPNVWEGHYLKFHTIYQAREAGKHYAELASRGKGKALPMFTVVPSPTGFKLWMDVKIGDELFGPNGDIVKVTGIPYEGPIELLRITLADGRQIECSREHEFNITYRGATKVAEAEWIGYNYHKQRKSSSKNPTGDEYVITLPIADKVEYPKQEIPIDAYTLGLILGDGCLRTPTNKNTIRLTGKQEDVDFYKSQSPYDITDNTSNALEHSIHKQSIMEDIKNLGLFMTNSHTKFIPDVYKYNSSEVRLALLQGLVDTDGWINNSTFCYCTCSEQLKNDVLEIARSLGIKAYSFKKKESWTISFQTAEYTLCRLPRKINKIKTPSARYIKSSKRVTVINVEYIAKTQGKCISVDREDGLFLANDYIVTHNSFCGASMLAKRFTLGEDEEVNLKVTSYITADDKKYLVNGDQTLDKFQFDIDWTSQNMEWPSKRLINSLSNMQWIMGYKDVDSGTNKGTLNSVVGVTSKDDPAKLRGSRGVLYILEEFGTFPALLDLVNNLRPSVEQDGFAFGTIVMYGTAGDKDSDFTSAQEIIYNPDGYNVFPLENVFDKEGQGKRKIGFFFPGYLNMEDCYNHDGVSDVSKSLLNILKDRFFVKYNSTKINTITKRIAEIPIVPQEAMLRTRGNMFPVTQLTQRLNEMDNDPSFHDSTYVGTLVQDSAGNVMFKPTTDIPIRQFPLKDNKEEGAIEIWEMPKKDSTGVPPNRYIIGHDPVDSDIAETASLTSTFVFDTFTDQIVAEYTGRQPFADDNFEIVRKLCIFYNAKCLYEQNKKGLFAYFKKMNCIWMLKDTPPYLKDIDVVRTIGYGNQSKGVNATKGVNDYANDRIKDWLLKPITKEVENENHEIETITVPTLSTIKSRGLLQELIKFNPDINVDRVRALGMVMLYREERLIIGKGQIKKDTRKPKIEDPYFQRNFDQRFNKNNN